MDKKSETVSSLNQLLKGEYMAIESFNNFISKINDENTKNVLQEIQKQHRQNINTLSSYIQDVDGRPYENLGMQGTMGQMKVNIDLGFKYDDMEIIEKAIEGETKGVNMAEKVLRGNLDDESRSVTGHILESDRRSINMLKSLI